MAAAETAPVVGHRQPGAPWLAAFQAQHNPPLVPAAHAMLHRIPDQFMGHRSTVSRNPAGHCPRTETSTRMTCAGSRNRSATLFPSERSLSVIGPGDRLVRTARSRSWPRVDALFELQRDPLALRRVVQAWRLGDQSEDALQGVLGVVAQLAQVQRLLRLFAKKSEFFQGRRFSALTIGMAAALEEAAWVGTEMSDTGNGIQGVPCVGWL